jgi:signal transduction histidine kinase
VYLPIPLDLLPLLMVSVTGTTLAVRAGVAAMRRDRRRGRFMPADRGELYTEPFGASFASSLLDIRREALEALREVDGLAARHRVRLQIAIQPDLAVRADPRGFRRALIDLLENAIGHAPGGKVLLGARRHGGRVQIAVLDDGQGRDRREQEAVLRPVERIVALHGGTLQIETRPGQGTLVVLRLPEPLSPPPAGPTARAAKPATRETASPESETSRA